MDEKITRKIIEFVKIEPRTIQEISKEIDKSWVTTEKYVLEIKQSNSLIDLKIFRGGSQASLKIVYYTPNEINSLDEIKNHLYYQIKTARTKSDFDVMDIYQYIDKNNKKAFVEEYKKEKITKQQLVSLLKSAKQQVFIFSGNLSLINQIENDTKIINVLEELLKNKITVRILTRVNFATVSNLEKLEKLLVKYPNYLEIKHSYQPLRGLIIDDKVVRLRTSLKSSDYKESELKRDVVIHYEIKDNEWVSWLTTVFWNIFKSAMPYKERLEELEGIKF